MIEKTLGNTEEQKLVWASLCSGLEKDLTEVLNRDVNISQRPFTDIFKAMNVTFLERNSITTRRLVVLRIVLAEEEQISDCLHKLVGDYKSLQLDVAPVETRCLLHLTTSLSECVKDFFV